MYYVYLLETQGAHEWYIGYTTNLRKRLEEHNSGRGGRTTARHQTWQLIYCEGYLTKADALGREKFLKSGSGRKYLKRQLYHYLEGHP